MLRRCLGMTLFFAASMVLLAGSLGWTQPGSYPLCASRPACRPYVCSTWGLCVSKKPAGKKKPLVTQGCTRFRCTNYQQKQY